MHGEQHTKNCYVASHKAMYVRWHWSILMSPCHHSCDRGLRVINVLQNHTANFFLQLSDGELASTFVTCIVFPLRRSWIKCVCACHTHCLLYGQKIQLSHVWWSVSAWSLNPFSVTVEYPSCVCVCVCVCVCSELYTKFMVCLYC